jgi:hypothetical protein
MNSSLKPNLSRAISGSFCRRAMSEIVFRFSRSARARNLQAALGQLRLDGGRRSRPISLEYFER